MLLCGITSSTNVQLHTVHPPDTKATFGSVGLKKVF
jgi:hypothetical protein